MINRIKIAIIATLHQDVLNEAKQPGLFLGTGVVLQISDVDTAAIYGRDDCSKAEMTGWLFSLQKGGNGCTELTNKESVAVSF